MQLDTAEKKEHPEEALLKILKVDAKLFNLVKQIC